MTRWRRLVRNGPLAWLLGAYWVGMSVLFAGLSARHLPLLSIVVGALGVALTARMAVMGVYTNGRELRCVSWFVSTRVPLAHVTAVRVVGYSGFGNRFSDSLLLSMLVIDREPDRAIVLRGTFGRFSTGKQRARAIDEHVQKARRPVDDLAAESTCRVCGFDEGDGRWLSGNPEYLICSCCSAESGVDDSTRSAVQRSRRDWVRAGMPWFEPGERPEPWDAAAQLGRVPDPWR